jgi:hypothetical protein
MNQECCADDKKEKTANKFAQNSITSYPSHILFVSKSVVFDTKTNIAPQD